MSFIIVLLLIGAAGLALAWWSERERRRRIEADHARELAHQRAHRERELREQSQRTVALFDRMVEGITAIDAAGRIRLANRAAGELFWLRFAGDGANHFGSHAAP